MVYDRFTDRKKIVEAGKSIGTGEKSPGLIRKLSDISDTIGDASVPEKILGIPYCVVPEEAYINGMFSKIDHYTLRGAIERSDSAISKIKLQISGLPPQDFKKVIRNYLTLKHQGVEPALHNMITAANAYRWGIIDELAQDTGKPAEDIAHLSMKVPTQGIENVLVAVNARKADKPYLQN